MTSVWVKEKWLKECNERKEYPFKLMPGGKNVFCKACEKTIGAGQKSLITQHHKASSHVKNMSLKKKRNATQSQLEDALAGPSSAKKSRANELGKELCEAMLSANIPFSKLDNPRYRDFLEKRIGMAMPDESTLRKTYLPECFEDAIEVIRTSLADCPIWIGVDETTDAQGRYVANVIAGKLDAAECSEPFLIKCAFLEKTDSSAIARLVNDTIHELWPAFKASNLKLMVSDAAAHMLKAGRDLKVFYPEMLHVTCLAHGLHRVCEQVREMFPRVNALISAVKKVFLKAPKHVLMWKEMCPDLPLPPEPILTRWGTWIEAAIFYAKNLDQVRAVLERLDSTEAAAIERAKVAVRDTMLSGDLAFLLANLAFIPAALKKMETAGQPVHDALSLMDEVKKSVDRIPGEKGQKLSAKVEDVLARNPDVGVLKAIDSTLRGEDSSAVLPPTMTPADMACFKYAPVTSVDVERSFSLYRDVLTDKRRRLTKENLSRIMVSKLFYNRSAQNEE